jgi:hypothetical protein
MRNEEQSMTASNNPTQTTEKMKKKRSMTTRRLTRWGLTLGLTTIMSGIALAQQTGGTIEIKLGTTVSRTWDDVKTAGYDYGPKQEFDASSKETHIWLPYGAKGVYFEQTGVKLTEPGPDGTGTPLVVSTDGTTSGNLVFKFHFDKPIGSLRFSTGWSEWGVGGDSVGGVEYSTDGKKWTTINEINKPGVIEPFCDGKKSFPVAKAQDLYIQCYSRDTKNPDAASGPANRWMKFRLAGDPTWGDASTTFFVCQMQLWVTPAE